MQSINDEGKTDPPSRRAADGMPAAEALSAPVGRPAGTLRATLGVAARSASSTVALGVVAVLTARELGPADRGIIVLAVATATLAMLVSSAGSNYAGRVLLVGKSPVPLPAFTALALTLCLAAVPCGALAVAVAFNSADVEATPAAILGIGVYTALLLASYLQREVLGAVGAVRSATSLELSGAVGQLVVVAFLLYVLRVSSAGPVLVGLAVAATAQVLLGLLTWRRLGLPVSASWSRPHAGRLLTRGRRGVAIGLAQALSHRFDRLVLGATASTAAVGVYAVAVTLSELLFFIPFALGQILSSQMARGATTRAAVQRVRAGNLALAMASALVVAGIAPSLIEAAFGPAFSEAVQPLRLLLIASVAGAAYHVDILCLNALGRTGMASVCAVAGAGLVLLLNLLLIPSRGAAGAAMSAAIGYTVMAVLVGAALQRALSRSWPSRAG